LSKIISGDNLTAYQRWEMPSVEQPSSKPEPAPVATPVPAEAHDGARPPKPLKPMKPGAALPTLEEIEAIQREAHEEGFAAGYQEGRREGREQGYKKGQHEGHLEGYQRGYAEGLAGGRDEVLLRIPVVTRYCCGSKNSIKSWSSWGDRWSNSMRRSRRS